MNKKVILLSILILLFVGGAIIFITTKQSSQTTATLSERSKAFIAQQQKDTNSDWKYARIEKGEDKAGAFVGKRVDVGDCFSFVMLFRVMNPRKESSCNWYFGTESPKGMVTAYMQKMEAISSVDEVDGVSMRRQFIEKYSERKEVIKGVTYLIFKNTDHKTYESSAFAYLPSTSSALIFNLIVPTTETYDKEFEAMLQSIEMK